ncbi:MAG: ATP-dependent Clp protease adaptor ClpS [Bacteroidia bacterium]|nr:ATP-dependent Clp protease adaptor ClpS [Bacteroidia bacterium]MCF8426838.1 ATP-dependent Clp protease adaptor ClpS [Bacteroidia bacterium]
MLKEVTKTEEEVDLLEETTDMFQVVLYNDDVNTFDWVIECLVDICEHDELQAEQCALLVHFKGKASVKKGELGQMNSICQALCDSDLSAVVE